MKAATKSGAAPLTPQQVAAQETQQRYGKPERGWREKVYTVIFEAETRTGRAFDLVLIGAILISVTVVVLSSVASVAERYGTWLTALEWFFTILFTAEYFARLSCLQHPVRYAKSFFGIIDLLAIVPTYIVLLLPGAHVLILLPLRLFRLLLLPRLLLLLRQPRSPGLDPAGLDLLCRTGPLPLLVGR